MISGPGSTIIFVRYSDYHIIVYMMIVNIIKYKLKSLVCWVFSKDPTYAINKETEGPELKLLLCIPSGSHGSHGRQFQEPGS